MSDIFSKLKKSDFVDVLEPAQGQISSEWDNGAAMYIGND